MGWPPDVVVMILLSAHGRFSPSWFAIGLSPVRWIRFVLTMPLSCDVNDVTLLASPFFGLKLSVRLFHLCIINNNNMVRHAMRLFTRFGPVFNVGIGHVSHPLM
jgi:hypothetical protein